MPCHSHDIAAIGNNYLIIHAIPNRQNQVLSYMFSCSEACSEAEICHNIMKKRLLQLPFHADFTISEISCLSRNCHLLTFDLEQIRRSLAQCPRCSFLYKERVNGAVKLNKKHNIVQ